MTITIKNIIWYGEGDATLPLTGVAEICVTISRTGNATIEVPAIMCIRGYVNGDLTLTGTGDVSLCGDLFVRHLVTTELVGNFGYGDYQVTTRQVYVDMGYLSKRFVAAGNSGGVRVSTGAVVQNAQDIGYNFDAN